MADRRGNQKVESMVVVQGAEEVKVPPAKRRRLARAVDKQSGSSSSAPTPTSPIKKFFVDMIAIEKKGAVKLPTPKVPRTKVPFYHDNKADNIIDNNIFILPVGIPLTIRKG